MSTSDAIIKRIIDQSVGALERSVLLVEEIWKTYQARLGDAKKLFQEEQLKRWVHGKQYFNVVVGKKRNQWFGQNKSEVWKKDLFESLSLPPDLDGLWGMMELPEKDVCADN